MLRLAGTEGLRSGRVQSKACRRVEETITFCTGSQATRPVTLPMRASSAATAPYIVHSPSCTAATKTPPPLTSSKALDPFPTRPSQPTTGPTVKQRLPIDPKACSTKATHARHESTSNTETISCATPTETHRQAGNMQKRKKQHSIKLMTQASYPTTRPVTPPPPPQQKPLSQETTPASPKPPVRKKTQQAKPTG